MRPYLYISDSKVDTLVPQVPDRIKRRIADEFTLDLKVLSIHWRTETTGDLNGARVSRLQFVEPYLREHAPIGGVGDPYAPWIAGRLPMRWGFCEALFCGERAKVVFFVGRQDDSYIALFGSAEHVIGTNSGPNSALSGSIAPTIIALLAREPEWLSRALRSGANAAREWLQAGVDAEQEALDRVVDLVDLQLGVRQEVEFLAKRLISGRTTRNVHDSRQGISVVLATPLLVHQTD